jgi:hypothetical protein
MVKWLITVLAVWSISTFSHANLFHDSNLDWKTIETRHFLIHFHDGAEKVARDFIPIANKVHDEVTSYLRWIPADKVHIVLTDEFDISNGFATVFPRNNTHIFIAAPDELNSLEDHNGWLELVFLHEYVHIVHLDKARGAPLFLRKIFGREGLFIPTVFPNAFQPAWFIEGIATYAETDVEQGIGRGQSTYYDMLMRGEVLAGVKELRRINQPIGSWPAGTIRYLYGVHYHNFIRDRFGDHKIKAMIEGISDNVVPYRIDSNTFYTFGRDLDGMWSEFNNYLHNKYDPVIERVRKQGLIEGKALTERGYDADSLRVLGNQAFYVSFNGRSHSALMRVEPGKPVEKLRDINFGARLDLHKDKGILIAQPEVCRNARVYYDLYRLDTDGNDYTRLTDCARYRQAVWSNKGDRIIAVHNELGINSLHVLTTEAELLEKIWVGEDGTQIGQMSYSPTEDILVASVWRKNQGWNLEKFDLATRQWSYLSHDKFIQAQPTFSEDGQSILYSADNDGIYNAYQFDLNTNTTKKLTNLLGGAFSPVMTDSGLYYLGYQSEGYDLYHMQTAQPIMTATVQLAEGDIITPEASKPVDSSESDIAVKDYSPWSSVTPSWWLPYFLIDDQRTEIGAQTFANDALYRHSYAVFAAYDIENDWVTGSFDYFYDGLWPIIHVGISRETDLFVDNNDDPQRIRAEKQALLEAIVPFTFIQDAWFVHAAIWTEREKNVWTAPAVTAFADTREDFAGLALRYVSAKRFPLSISRSEGRDLRLIYEDTDVIGNSDQKGQTLVGDWREFLHFGDEHVLALRLVEGRGENNSKPFRLGGIQSTNPLAAFIGNGTPIFDEREYSLRGYDEGRSQLIGQNMRLFSAEYRFPIWRIEHGWMAPPVGFNQLHGTLFYDTGGVWADPESKPATYYDSIGLELNTEMDLLYDFRLNIVLGFASGLDDTIGEDKVYLRIGSQF